MIHVHLGDQTEVGHVVVLHALERTMLCYLLNYFFSQIAAQEIRNTPESRRQVLEETRSLYNVKQSVFF